MARSRAVLLKQKPRCPDKSAGSQPGNHETAERACPSQLKTGPIRTAKESDTRDHAPPAVCSRTESRAHALFDIPVRNQVTDERLDNESIFEEEETNAGDLAALDCTHWLEVMDERHRYGTYLRPYYEAWLRVGAPKSFFTWLDDGEGLNLNLEELVPRSHKVVSRQALEHSRVLYCTETEREQYRAVIQDGLLVWTSENAPNGMRKGSLVDTDYEPKWIFVIDVFGQLYVNRKRKFSFHHSSFVAGAPVRAAGRISIERGRVVCIGPNSGHYRTTWEQLMTAVDKFFGNDFRVVPPYICSTHDDSCITLLTKSTIKAV